jgi:hypothetical protein
MATLYSHSMKGFYQAPGSLPGANRRQSALRTMIYLDDGRKTMLPSPTAKLGAGSGRVLTN